MIGKIKKGSKMIGLVNYLAGPGRSNEHTDMHVVCASELVVSVREGEALDADNTAALGQELDRPKKTYEPGAGRRAHVFHVSLSLDAEQGIRDDEFWGTVSREYLDAMGFTGDDGAAPCRWAAIRHGVSGKGNDHVHIAVSMIREDGTRWSTANDFRRSSKVLRELEQRHGLRVLGQGVKTQGYAEGERESVARRRAFGRYERERRSDPTMTPWKALPAAERKTWIDEQLRIDQPREDMALRLRAAAAQSRDEGEFVRRARGQGLLVRPRFAEGSVTDVTGYSVALRPTEGERPIWYGGGRLGKDLTLPALRSGWGEEHTAAAQSEWRAAARNGSFSVDARSEISPEVRVAYFRELSGYAETLATGVAHRDPERLAAIARAGAGALSSWAVAAGDQGADDARELRRAAKEFSRHATLTERPSRAVRPVSDAAADVALVAVAGMSDRAGMLAMIRAWSKLGEELGKAYASHRWAQRADRLALQARADLDAVHERYRAVGGNGPATVTQAPAAVAVAPAPTIEDVERMRRDRQAQITSDGRAAGLSPEQIEARLQAQRAVWAGTDSKRGPALGEGAGETRRGPVFRPEPDGPDQQRGRSR